VGRQPLSAARPAQFLLPGAKQNSPGCESSGSSVLSSASFGTTKDELGSDST